MATFASVVIQDLTYTEKMLGLGVTISYTNGSALAVTVSDHAISVAITPTSTATQIKAAVDAHAVASALVTVTVSGTGADIQLTCKSAALAGGAATAKASLTIGDCMKLTADTTGAGGNSIRFKFTTGATAGAEVCTVSTNDITVQIAEGVSTFLQVKTAIEAEAAAAALVDVTFTSGNSQVARLAMAPAFTALSGGVTAAAASVIVQDLTIAADATGVAANGITFNYTTGATAGAEVVTVSASAISVQIENGVSTATQIAAALNAAAPFTSVYNVTISGTGATAQFTVNGAAMTGAIGDGALAYGRNEGITALTASFVKFSFGFMANELTLVCNEAAGAKGVVYSFDGVTTHGTLLFGQRLELTNSSVDKIWMKYVSAAPAYQLTAVGR